MKKPQFSLAQTDKPLETLIRATDHKTLAEWAIACALRVLPYFENAYPDDKRPRTAIETLQAWLETGEFKMEIIRRASLDAHAAAREVGEDNPARSAARAAGQAVATAHVRTHAIGAAMYGLQALYRASSAAEVASAIATERAWHYQRLLDRSENQRPQSPQAV